MHGRKKTGVTPSKEFLDAQQAKIESYEKIVELITQYRTAKVYDKDALFLVGKVLRSNPDYYSLWNYRREILIDMNKVDE
jgi:geranylgeranyl transferase type-2 subunit alpha